MVGERIGGVNVFGSQRAASTIPTCLDTHGFQRTAGRTLTAACGNGARGSLTEALGALPETVVEQRADLAHRFHLVRSFDLQAHRRADGRGHHHHGNDVARTRAAAPDDDRYLGSKT
jgi:hypothetical protein